SAYDRWMPTLLGYGAVQEVLEMQAGDPAVILGVQFNRIARLPLMQAVANTDAVAQLIADGQFTAAAAQRGTSFTKMVQLNRQLAKPPVSTDTTDGPRIAVMHAGGLAPGMNTAARAAVRLGIASGHQMLGIDGGFPGWPAMSANLDGRMWKGGPAAVEQCLVRAVPNPVGNSCTCWHGQSTTIVLMRS
ncbi:MAG: 6-phosphofructokinase, partial [Bowdeniella nasicola]|nr:6-phosphofructokinase [Bowdeniella nasicola]